MTSVELFKAVAQNSVKFLAGREGRIQKQREEEEKRLRLNARSVALGVREFWKVIESLVSQKYQVRRGTTSDCRAALQERQVEQIPKRTFRKNNACNIMSCQRMQYYVM